VVPGAVPPPVSPPLIPAMPGKPNLMSKPMAPTPLAEPMLPPASGAGERLGDMMESNVLSGLTGGGGIKGKLEGIGKLAGLKYLLGGAALPAEAAYLALNALTSPGAVGQVARMTFRQGGINAIDTWAQRYPS